MACEPARAARTEPPDGSGGRCPPWNCDVGRGESPRNGMRCSNVGCTETLRTNMRRSNARDCNSRRRGSRVRHGEVRRRYARRGRRNTRCRRGDGVPRVCRRPCHVAAPRHTSRVTRPGDMNTNIARTTSALGRMTGTPCRLVGQCKVGGTSSKAATNSGRRDRLRRRLILVGVLIIRPLSGSQPNVQSKEPYSSCAASSRRLWTNSRPSVRGKFPHPSPLALREVRPRGRPGRVRPARMER